MISSSGFSVLIAFVAGLRGATGMHCFRLNVLGSSGRGERESKSFLLSWFNQRTKSCRLSLAKIRMLFGTTFMLVEYLEQLWTLIKQVVKLAL